MTTSSEFYEGQLDEVRVWNYARSQTEILAQKDVKIAGSTPGLVAYYRFNQGLPNANNAGITTLDDESPSNANGTLNGFALTGNSSNWTEPGAPLDCCLDIRNVDNNPIDTKGYAAFNEVHATGTVPGTSNVVFAAPNAIELNPNFEVMLGGVFEVMLKGCVP